jgi:IS30 family transposase
LPGVSKEHWRAGLPSETGTDQGGHASNRISIDERPGIVAEKPRIVDREIETVIGKNHQDALVTVVDRVSKFTLIIKVASKHAEVVTAATIVLPQPYLDKALTITADNGKVLWSTKTGHFLRQLFYKNPAQIPAGFDSRV